ncbi:MAG: AAA family ATPase [Verrucomicrobia bacterium]|nr:AAA family ATPase [Verrucomicrobiota bacterium]MDA1087693.1 AAA family ATPase [Verrucomicrobiota bacterium]
MSHLRSIELSSRGRDTTVFPFSVPVFQSFEPMMLDAPVSFLVGENGSGKSTFLEALAIAVGSVVVGGEDLAHDRSLDHVRGLVEAVSRRFLT